MAIPVALILIAIGAILAFAVTGSSSAVDIPTVGWILMGTGFVGLVLSLIMWDSWAGGGYWRRRTAYADAPPAGPARRRVVHEEVEDAPPPAPPP
jgi:uncharacterized protein DUF6458